MHTYMRIFTKNQGRAAAIPCPKGSSAPDGGPSYPTWLGDKLTVEALQSLHIIGVSWKSLPSLGKIWGLDTLILKRIATMKEFVIEQRFCRLIKLKLVGLRMFEKWVPSLDTCMFPILQVLIIRQCPKLSVLPFSYPSQDWKTDWFPKLQELEIEGCPEFLLVARIPWAETLHWVKMSDVKLLEKFVYNSKSSDLYISGKDDLQSLDQVLAFSNMAGLEQLTLKKCPSMEWKHLVMLTSLKTMHVESSDSLVEPFGGEGTIEWQPPFECLVVRDLHGASGKDLTELLTHLPSLSKLSIIDCENITQLVAGVDVWQHTVSAAATSQEKKDEDGLLVLPCHLASSLRELCILTCPELVLIRGSGGGLQALRSLQVLKIDYSPKFLSAISSFSCCLFPSSLQDLHIKGVKGMRTLEPLSNLTSLTRLDLWNCGKDLRCKGMEPLLTPGGQLRKSNIHGSPRFFAGWDPNPRQVLLQQDEGGEKQRLQQLVSAPITSKLQELWTDEAMGLLSAPICSLLSSSLTKLHLHGFYQVMERFTEDQEDALHLLVSLQWLRFSLFSKLQHLPAGLQKLTSLRRLEVDLCPALRSLPEDGLPKSLKHLQVSASSSEELKQQCMRLAGSIEKIIVD